MDLEGLAGQLCVTAGMIMEDAAVSAISTNEKIDVRVADLVRASELLRALASAASALVLYEHQHPS